ncbi:MAG: polysaccharide biosynthesis protein PslG [Solirubrobacteraceae bacterium]|nr:polysaccharide biosynthesis protein PslG [Solirubrobacteraceae bacterium]
MRRSVVALAAAISCCIAPTAEAAPSPPPSGFYGVAASGPVLDGRVSLTRELRRMRSNGVEQISVSLYWSQVEPSGPPDVAPEDWSELDTVVAKAAAKHLRVLPVVVGAPAWARLDATLPFSPPADPAAYGAFVGRAAARYGRGGTFWKAHKSLPSLPIRDWQIWNEPSGGNGVDDPSIFWQDAAPWADRYVAMLKASRAALRQADPSARVVLGGLLGRSWDALSLLYAHGAGPYFDILGVHPYTGHADRVDDLILKCLSVLNSHGDRRKRVIATELGWPSFNSPSYKQVGATQTAKDQRQYAYKMLHELSSEHKALRLDAIFWFTWMTTDTSANDAFDYSGLTRFTVKHTVVAKPALGVFRQLALSARRARAR